MTEQVGVLKLLANETCVRWLVALLHFLWQGAVIGAAVVFARRALATASARVRYALHAAALLSLPVCVAVTFWTVEAPASLRVSTLSQVPVERASRSHCGRFLATATSGDLLRVWDVATWAKLRDFKGHAGIQTVAFGAGERLFSGSADTAVLAWDLRN